MERGDRGAKVSLPSYASPGNESKHYFNATVVSNACARGVAGEWEDGMSGVEKEVEQRPSECK
jgi:hypothetical protein